MPERREGDITGLSLELVQAAGSAASSLVHEIPECLLSISLMSVIGAHAEFARLPAPGI